MGGYEEMKCNKCNTENPDNSKFCINCGEPLLINNQNKQKPKKSSALSTASMILGIVGLLLTVVVIGIIPSIMGLILGIIALVMKKPKRDRAIAGTTISLVAIIFFLVLLTGTSDTEDKTEKKVENQQIDQENNKNLKEEAKKKKEEITSDKDIEEQAPMDFVSQLSKYIDKSVAEKANDIIVNQIGFPEVELREKMGETTNFEISLDGVLAVLTASDDVYRIFVPDSDYTFYEDGVVKMTAQQFDDVTIDSYEQSSYYSIAKEIVESCLKSPKSADFPTLMFSGGDIAMKKSGDIVAVQSYVDAENSFGAEMRSQYIVEFRVIDLDSFSYEVIYVNIDGETYGTYIEI